MRLPKRARFGVMLVASLLVVTACGDDSSNPIFATTGDLVTSASVAPGGTTPSGGDGTSDTAGIGEATATTDPASQNPLDIIANADFTPSGDAPRSLVGTPDTRSAAAIADDLAAGGIDLTGVEVWVFPVTGSDERLLVFSVNPAAAGLSEDPTGGNLFEVLAAAPSLPDSGITRFVLNYYDSDDQGEFVLTTTVPMDLLLDSIANDTDVSEFVEMQLMRDGVAQ